MAEEPVLLVNREDEVMTLTLNRPKVHNAFNFELTQALLQAIEGLVDDPGIRVVVITGAGDRTFCAGADLKEAHSMTLAERLERSRAMVRMQDAISALPMPVVLAINGHCLGGGFEVMLCGDVRIAVEHATFGLPQIIRGGYPGSAAVRILQQLPLGKAKELVFTGRRISAREAERIGLIERVVSKEQLRDEVEQLVEEMLAVSPLGLRQVKQVMNIAAGTDLATGLALAWAMRSSLEGSRDRKEALAAFVEKRRAVFRGE